MLLLIIVIFLFTGYSILIIYYLRSWNSIPAYPAGDKVPSLSISVIIPCRNEEKNIGNLLQALSEQTYPKELYEIIVVDDHSEDGTAGIVSKFENVNLISLKEDQLNSYKKKAIEKGIADAKGDFIITTDADCIPPPNWLRTIAAFKEERKAVFITAPVVFDNNTSLLQVFQSLDFLTLQGITGASVHRGTHSMCNGANLAYEKKVFYEVNGFSGIDHIASGDDMLLMHKIWKKYPAVVHYLKSKDAIVSTKPMETWKQFFNQRIRWASKAKYYDDKRVFFVLLLVYLFNLSFLILLVAGCWFPVYWLWLVGLWIAKTILEFPFVYSVARFFGKEKLMKYFFFFQPLHIAYTLISGLLGQIGKYEWKGRIVR
jgi:cellulose synthase/poly-beta-1,6-N-acetylglucosamine synthase-like glycosyltransferase